MQAALRLGTQPDAAAHARAYAADALPGVPRELLDDAQLVLTELVTNAQLHGAPPIAVRARAVDGGVRVEVEDSSRQMLVIPAHSVEAMTGRGLALVAALSRGWGVEPGSDGGKVVWAELSADRSSEDAEAPDVDLDALLSGWDDEEPAEPEHTIRLGSVPTELLLEAKRHIDNVVRELTLERVSASASGPLPEELSALIDTVTRDFAAARSGIKRQAAEAAARGDVETELVLTLPASSVAAGERYLAALDEADRYARHARLLTLETPPLHRVFRRWYVRALVEQLRAASQGRAAQQPRRFVQVLSDEVAALSGLRETAERLAVLQRVNAQLAQARTPSDMAAVVVRVVTEELGALSARVYVLEGDLLRSVAVSGGASPWLERYEEVPLGGSLPGPDALRSRRIVSLHGRDQIASHYPVLRGVYDDDRSLHVAPLVVEGQRLGVLSVALPAEARLPRDEQAPFVQAVADALGQALERSRAGEAAAGADVDVDYLALFRALPTSYMVMDRDLVLLDANDAYLATVGRSREELVGRYVFDAFPPTPDAIDPATGKSRVQLSFELARDTGRPDTMPVQKYDIPDPAGTGFVERYWSLISVPIADRAGRVGLVAQRAEDITDFVRERERGEQAQQDSAEWRRRAEEVQADLFARAQELESALGAKDRNARRLASLAAVALGLTSAESVEDLARVVFSTGLPVLGADGGAVGIRDDAAGLLRVVLDESLAEDVQLRTAEVPLTGGSPLAHAALTGEPVVLPDRAAAEAFWPGAADAYAATQRSAWVTLPLRAGDELLGGLAVSWRDERALPPEDLELLEGFAAQVAQGMQRIRVTASRREAALAAQRMSETLQRSLLTEPPELEGLRIAVRYRPAAAEAHVGGDWYDAFLTSAGSALLVIGDVTGHDRAAAAAMGQVRNLLRGLAYDSADGPAVLLSRLDAAMHGLDLGVLATALLARVERSPDGLRLRWSNAGHPSAVLREPDGAARLLQGSDLMLGIDPASPRADHLVDLAPGTTLVLLTDGLVERRDADIDEGVARVVAQVQEHGDRGADALADALLEAVDEGTNHDDIALLVLRVGDGS